MVAYNSLWVSMASDFCVSGGCRPDWVVLLSDKLAHRCLCHHLARTGKGSSANFWSFQVKARRFLVDQFSLIGKTSIDQKTNWTAAGTEKRAARCNTIGWSLFRVSVMDKTQARGKYKLVITSPGSCSRSPRCRSTYSKTGASLSYNDWRITLSKRLK